MSVFAYLKCLFGRRGHRFKPSVSHPGKETCTFCHYRRRATGRAY